MEQNLKEQITKLYEERLKVQEIEQQLGVWKNPNGGLSKEELMKTSHKLWLDAFAGQPPDIDDHKAMDALMDKLQSMAKDEDLLDLQRLEAARRYYALLLPDAQLQLLLLSSWANCGYRQLIMGHRYAAALMATKMPRQMVDEVRPPWPVFLVDIPSGMLFITNQNGEPKEVAYGLVRYGMGGQKGEERMGWSYILYAKNDGSALWGYNMSPGVAYFGDKPETDDALSGTPFGDGVSKLDERSRLLFWRLVFGLCVAMQDKDNYRPTKSANRVHNKRNPGPPLIRTYIVGKTPSVDCRQSVIDYVQGRKHGGGPMTVQVLVCGHWRQQPYGPQSKLRKTIWIEPYWKGPEDAPIMVRPKAVG
jgi:hypothetical protein